MKTSLLSNVMIGYEGQIPEISTCLLTEKYNSTLSTSLFKGHFNLITTEEYTKI